MHDVLPPASTNTAHELVKRFASNPILRPADCRPSREDVVVECLLNPGAFRHNGRVGLLLRVAERPVQEEGWISVPVVDEDAEGGVKMLRFSRTDPDVKTDDTRVFYYKGDAYLTTLSHLRLAWSDDNGQTFTIDERPTLIGHGALQSFGIEDSRVAHIDGKYWLTYTAVSPAGVGVGLTETADWQHFTHHGMAFSPQNKDVAFFEEKINGYYYALHRPMGAGIGGNFIWTARSPDLLHWGDHRCIAFTRPGQWDSARVGGGASPIKTPEGWLCIYHGANEQHRYCLGLLLLDLNDPTRVIARSLHPIMEPTARYEQTGFFAHVVFTNGHIIDGDTITMYYGASDEVICAATLSISELLASLRA